MISAKPVRQLFLGGALVTFLLLDAFSFQWPTICSRIVSHGLWSGSALWGKNEDAAVEWLGNGFSLQEDQLIGLYVHIPYCRRRCRYCNFAIVPIGIHADTETTELTSAQSGFRELDQKYTNSLLKEFDLLLTNSRDDTIAMKKIPLCSIYVGGGTPSLAPIETLRRIMATILDKNRSPFTINADKCEISIEADPGTFSLQKLQFFKEIGFNRLSLGVQSFDNSILESLGRIHRSEDIVDSIAMIRRVYGDDANYSIDLISGLPGLTLATWLETLEKAVNLEPRPKHLSIYDLQVESGTVFGNWYGNQDHESAATTPFHSTKGEAPVSKKILRLPSSRESAFMYKYAAGYLRWKGYEHYEVSSYAFKSSERLVDQDKSYRSQHNQIYWALDSQWFAIGLGATSFVNGSIVARPRTMVEYRRWVEDQVTSSVEHSERVDFVSDLDLLMDAVLKRLRTAEGLSLDWVQHQFGDAYERAVLRGSQLGRDLAIIHLDEPANVLRLVDPDGFLYSNSIISSIFMELESV